MSTCVKITGPARQLLRVREREASLARVERLLGAEGPATAVRMGFVFEENGQRITLTLDRAAWHELATRVQRAFTFDDSGPLPGQGNLF